MPKPSLAKLERHLYAAADILRGTPFWERLERALPDWRERKEEMHVSASKFVQFSLS